MSQSRRIALWVLAALLVAAPFAAIVVPLLGHSGTRATDFTLTDDRGQPFDLAAQRGSAVVLFFGYTNCPDICPATLGAIAAAYRKLGAPAGLKVAFVTVDPRRDTVAALHRYIGLFDARFYGLTGDPHTLQAVYKAYGVYAKADADPSSALGYTVTHTAAVYLIDKDGNVSQRLDWNASEPEFAAAFRKALS